MGFWDETKYMGGGVAPHLVGVLGVVAPLMFLPLSPPKTQRWAWVPKLWLKDLVPDP